MSNKLFLAFFIVLFLFACTAKENNNLPNDNNVEIKNISVNVDEVTLVVEEKYNIIARVEPFVATAKLQWSSSNSQVASVDNGTIEAKSKGTATITVYLDNGLSKNILVTVISKVVQNESKTLRVVDAKVTEHFGDFTLAFSIKDNSNKFVIEKATVKIEIKNASGKIVYSGDHFVEKDFYSQNIGYASVMSDYLELGNSTKDSEGTFMYVIIVDDKKIEEKSVKIIGLPIKEETSNTNILTIQSTPFEVEQMYVNSVVNKYVINEIKISKGIDGVYYADVKATKTYDWRGDNAASTVNVKWRLENGDKVYASDTIFFSQNILVTQDFSFRVKIGKLVGSGFRFIIY